MDSAVEEVSGPVDLRHSYVDMPRLNVQLSDGTTKQLCRASMGYVHTHTHTYTHRLCVLTVCNPVCVCARRYAFAAGTTDGPGMFGFHQGTTTGT
jgi:hypothetical protein